MNRHKRITAFLVLLCFCVSSCLTGCASGAVQTEERIWSNPEYAETSYDVIVIPLPITRPICCPRCWLRCFAPYISAA